MCWQYIWFYGTLLICHESALPFRLANPVLTRQYVIIDYEFFVSLISKTFFFIAVWKNFNLASRSVFLEPLILTNHRLTPEFPLIAVNNPWCRQTQPFSKPIIKAHLPSCCRYQEIFARGIRSLLTTRLVSIDRI